MNTLYKPIIGLGGGIRHIFDVKSSNKTDYMDQLKQNNIGMINLTIQGKIKLINLYNNN